MNPEPPLPLSFSLSELAGSLGDFGTIIPLILAVALVSDVDPRYILFFFGLWFILTGLYYRLPIPLEPMKAIAVVVIAASAAGGISAGEIAAAGLILGVIFLVLGYGRFFSIIERWVPGSVVRGIQLGLALLLFRSSAGFITTDPLFFGVGIAIIIAFMVLVKYRSIPDLSSICVIGAGFIGGILISGIPPVSLIPAPQLVIPAYSDILPATTTLVLPQLVLTIANAILATSLLTKDLFGKDVPPRKFSTTIGLMNLTSVPFGGFPMCHGAGGLAGQYRYGARTGGANIYAGLIFLILALFFTSPQVLSIIAVGVLGALLVFVGIEMGRHSLKTDSLIVTVVIGILALISSMTLAFITGMVIAFVAGWIKKRPVPGTD
ncbi:MAG: putative sulfate/molybdate transporter [Methanoregula sp.]|uniref:putative sulfate/molybdate transporter n=1 Tax=Methanoregula sp. TaxID=2052170 RepID=UPI0025DDE964|nr:putative sulfate/molybdate transporter [Methanoregula sp.]MCK9630567.1 putative sulfate/molybdate transporter [Methanoregula sp.]